MPRSLVPATLMLAVLALAAACADLPPIASHVCGNGVVDPREDCDTFSDPDLGTDTKCGAPSDTTRACRYVCSQTQRCPTGWACGSDGICRYSSGIFSLSPDGVQRISTDLISVGRFDRDIYSDLLAVSASTVELRQGSADGRFASSFQTSIELPWGPPAIGDLDQDQRSDLVLPIGDGLFVMRGGENGTLEPVAYSPIVIPPVADGVQVLPLRLQADSFFDRKLVLLAGCMLIDPGEIPVACPDEAFPLPTGRVTRELAGRVPFANLAGDSADELALAFAGDNRVYVYGVHDLDPTPEGSELAIQLVATIQLDGPITREYGVRFGDVDGNGQLDVLASIGGIDADEVAVAYNFAGHFEDADHVANHAKVEKLFTCLVDLCECNGDPECPEQIPRPHRWPLALGKLDGNSFVDVINEQGVFIRSGPDPEDVVITAYSNFFAPWIQAAIADFNHDGTDDIAVASSNERGIDFFIGVGTGLFNPAHVETSEPPVQLRTGDFDGDLVIDLAIAEQAIGAGRDEDSLSVLFGKLQGAPQPPISMGKLRHIEVMEPGRLGEGPTLDQISDLIVESSDKEGSTDRSLASLIGSSQRRMFSPFRLAISATFFDNASAILVGRLTGHDTVPDLLAFASRIWVIRGAGGARFNPQDAHSFDYGPLFASTGGKFDDNSFCTQIVAADLDHDLFEEEEIVAVDNHADCNNPEFPEPPSRSHLLVGSVGSGNSLVGEVFDLPAELLGPSHTALADLDADTHPDLVVLFEGWKRLEEDSLLVSQYGVVVYWGQDGGFDTAAPLILPALPDGAEPTALAIINADGDRQLELAVLSTAGVYLAHLDPGTRKFAAPVLAIPQPGTEMVTGDVNADGLDDLIIVDLDLRELYVYLAEANLVSQDGR